MLFGCNPSENLQYAVSELDLERYAGTWYEIARFDHSFERGLICNQAHYTLRPDGKIDVLNRGVKSANPEKLSRATAIAYPAGDTPGHLKVRFFRLFAGDYIVTDLDPDYRYAVVVSSSKRYVWILSREKMMDDALYEELVSRLRSRAFPVDQLIRVPQSCPDFE